MNWSQLGLGLNRLSALSPGVPTSGFEDATSVAESGPETEDADERENPHPSHPAHQQSRATEAAPLVAAPLPLAQGQRFRTGGEV